MFKSDLKQKNRIDFIKFPIKVMPISITLKMCHVVHFIYSCVKLIFDLNKIKKCLLDSLQVSILVVLYLYLNYGHN